MSNSDAGFLYFSYGEPFIDETFESIKSLKLHNPRARIALITDKKDFDYCRQKSAAAPIEYILPVEINKAEPGWLFKTRLYALTPFKKTIHLDGDTFILGPIEHLFDLLDVFDFVAVPDESAPARGSILGLKGGFAALGYYNCGFYLFRRSDPVKDLFENWRDEYESLGPLEPGDQGPLVRALIKTNVRFITLPKEYNLRIIDKCVSFQSTVKVLHGRSRHPEKLEKMFNQIECVANGSRVYIPNLQRVIHSGAFNWISRFLRFFNLDVAQKSAHGRVDNKSPIKKIWGLVSKKTEVVIPMPSNASANDLSLLHHIITEGAIKSFLEFNGPNKARMEFCHQNGIHAEAGSFSGSEKFDLVWAEGVKIDVPRSAQLKFIDDMSSRARRFLFLTLNLPRQIKTQKESLNYDWFWVDKLRERGFYFDAHKTLSFRTLGESQAVRLGGLFFERIQVEDESNSRPNALSSFSRSL